MKQGDLICYNAAGQKYKTMGIVISLGEKPQMPMGLVQYETMQLTCLIFWCLIGDYMPRVVWKTEKEWGCKVTEKKPYRHLVGDWFEVISEMGS